MVPVKLRDQILCHHVLFRNPGIVLVTIALPFDQTFDQIFKTVPPQTTVQDCLQFIMLLSINEVRRRQRLRLASRDRIFWSREEFDDIKHRMESIHRGWGAEPIRIATDSGSDGVRPQKPMS